MQAGAGGGVVDVDGEGLGECGLVKSSNWVTCDARGQGTYLVILDQRLGERADHGHILECRLALCKPSMRKYRVFDELEDGVRHVAP